MKKNWVLRFYRRNQKDLLKIIPKIRGFIVENSNINFGIIYNDDEDNGYVINYKTEANFVLMGYALISL